MICNLRIMDFYILSKTTSFWPVKIFELKTQFNQYWCLQIVLHTHTDYFEPENNSSFSQKIAENRLLDFQHYTVNVKQYWKQQPN